MIDTDEIVIAIRRRRAQPPRRADATMPDDLYHRGPCCPCERCGGRECYVLHGDAPDAREHHFCVGCHGEWILGLLRDAEGDGARMVETTTDLVDGRAGRR